MRSKKAVFNKQFKFAAYLAITVVLSLGLSLSLQSLLAANWAAPSAAPPSPNLKPPVYDSDAATTTATLDYYQVGLTGLLTVMGGASLLDKLDVAGNLGVGGNISLSADRYINFGATPGEPGYGLRDSLGTIQIKDSGGSWVALSGGGTVNPGLSGQLAYYESGGQAVSGTSSIYIAPDGNVGIGTDNPQEKLEVFNGDIKISKNNGVTARLKLATSGGTAPADYMFFASGLDGAFGIYDNIAAQRRFTINKDGNVGIGTSTPAGKLEIAQNLFVYNPGDGGSTNGGYIQCPCDVDSNKFDCSHTFSFTTAADWCYDHVGTYYIYFHKDTSYPSLFVSKDGHIGIGTNAPKKEVHINADTVLFTDSSVEMRMDNWTSTVKDWIVEYYDSFNLRNGIFGATSFTSRFYISPDGKVGIGTTTPGDKLIVDGNIGLNPNGYLNFGYMYGSGGYGLRDSGGTIQFKNRGGSWTALSGGSGSGTVNSASQGQLAYYETGGQAVSGTSSIYISPNGRVGIGTDIPNYRLTVKETAAQAGIYIWNDAANPELALGNGTAGSHWAMYHDLASDDLRFWKDAANRMVITDDGKVGIGTENPAGKFVVAQNLFVWDGLAGGVGTGGYAKCSCDTNAASFDCPHKFNDPGFVGDWCYDQSEPGWYNYFHRDTAYPAFSVSDNGWIGIGTVNPRKEVEIKADDILLTDSSINIYMDNIKPGIKDWLVDAMDDFNIRSGEYGVTGWTSRLHISPDGKVGIGTENPGAKLHVGGVAGVDGIMFPDGTLQTSAGGGAGADTDWTIADPNIYRLTGNVGVGESNPSELLHLDNGNLLIDDVDADTGNIILGGWGGMTQTDGNGRINFYSSALINTYTQSTAEAASRITMHTDGIKFFSAPAGAYPNPVTWTERMRITEAGVGIGTGNETINDLLVVGPYSPEGNAQMNIRSVDNLGVDGGAQLHFSSSRGTIAIPQQILLNDRVGSITGWGYNNLGGSNLLTSIDFEADANVVAGTPKGRIVLKTNNGDGSGVLPRLTIKADGKVGIGTGNPGAKLDIDMTSLTTTEGLRISRDAAASHYAYLNIFNESNNPVFKVHESGNVGIGTENPGSLLEVKKTDTSTAAGQGQMANFDYTISPSANQVAGKKLSALNGYAQVPAGNSNSVQDIQGIMGSAENYGSGNVLNLRAIYGWAYNASNVTINNVSGLTSGTEVDAGTVDKQNGLSIWQGVYGGTVNNLTGVRIWGMDNVIGATVTNAQGVYIQTMDSDIVNRWGIYQEGANDKNYFAGNVGIGDLSPAYKLEIGGGDVNTTGGGYRDAGVCVAGTCASDLKLKNNITPISGALDKVGSLNPVSFEFIDPAYGPGIQYGLIAQDVEKIFPEMVTTGEDGFLKIRYGLELQMQVIQAVKELKKEKDAEIEGLRSEIEMLKSIICIDYPEAEICEK